MTNQPDPLHDIILQNEETHGRAYEGERPSGSLHGQWGIHNEFATIGRGIASPQLITFFRKHLEGSTLLDVGGGNPSQDGRIALVRAAELSGVKRYRVVDRYAFPSSPFSNDIATLSFTRDSGMVYEHFTADALGYLTACIDDGSVSVMMNGLDQFIISPDYAQALAREIERILEPGRIAFGINSWPLELLHGCSESALIKHPHLKGNFGLYVDYKPTLVLEKPEN